MQSRLENDKGYEKGIAMKSLDKKNPYFTKFTVIHGTADNALHFQNSALMSKRIIEAGFEFNNYFVGDGQSVRSRYIPHRYMHDAVDRKGENGVYFKNEIVARGELVSQKVLKIVIRKLDDCRNGTL